MLFCLGCDSVNNEATHICKLQPAVKFPKRDYTEFNTPNPYLLLILYMCMKLTVNKEANLYIVWTSSIHLSCQKTLYIYHCMPCHENFGLLEVLYAYFVDVKLMSFAWRTQIPLQDQNSIKISVRGPFLSWNIGPMDHASFSGSKFP